MPIQTRLPFAACCLMLSFACSSEPGTPGGSAGHGGGGIGGASGGPSSGGGGVGGQMTAGGTSAGGQVGTGGSVGSGGVSSSGGAAAGGSGGAVSGGAAGTGGNGGSGGGGSAPTKSAGCGKAGRPAGGKVYVAGVSWLMFPESYDGETPLPVLFGFHGCGGSTGNRGNDTRTEYTDRTNGTAFEDEYVRAIPLSTDTGGCWDYEDDIVRVTALYDQLTQDYCVDTSRVFATGHSSGAQFIVQLLNSQHTAHAEHLKFKGVAPVAASPAGAIGTPTPIMYIQNVFDEVRMSSGEDVVQTFVAGNSCDSTSSALTVQGAGCNSDDGPTVTPGCISYGGCDVPTIWCSHNDPAYDSSGHGIPCFTAQATDEFFKSLD